MWKDKVTNESVLTKLKTKRQLLSDIQKRRLKYFGHIKIKNNTLTTVLEGKLEGKRPRGWPWNNWMVDIKEWTCQPAYACTSQAADRDLWSVNARQLSKRWWHSQIPDTRNGTFWNRSAYHLSSYNCSVNRPCLIESLWKNYIHASELCCCDDAVWKLFTGISQFCSIFLELLQHLICCSFGLTLRQVLYKAMLTFSFHMISRILFFIWEQPKYSGCCGISVDQSEHQIKSMIDLSLILTISKFSSQNGMRNMKDTMALLQALPFPFPRTPLTSYACLFSPFLSVSSACHTGYMVEQRCTWLGKDKQMTQVLVSLHKFSYKQMLINTIM